MKKIVVFISFSVALLGMTIVQSCTPCGGEAIYFRTQSISSSVLKITGVDTSGCCDVFKYEEFSPDEKSIRYDSLLIRVVSDNQAVFNERPAFFNFGINSTYACSPAETYDVFEEVNITSNQNYGAAYPAGSLLNDMVSVSWDARVLSSQINNLMINNYNDFKTYYFKFNVAPDSVKVHDITIEYIFTDGRSLKSTIKGVTISK